MRINKFLAQAGLASRRKAEEFVLAGKVKVNGKVVASLATDVKETDSVVCDGKPLRVSNSFVYYKLNKPKGYVSTAADDKGRKTVIELMRGVKARIFPVGRLDYDSEGLLLLTNDGDLSNILTKPNSKVEKTYMVTIEGCITPLEIKTLSNGVDIGGYTTQPCSVQIIETKLNSTRLQFVITEGKNRQIRKMLEAVNKTVTLLKRVQIGEIRLGGLSRGEYAKLSMKELQYINKLKSN